MTYKKTGANYFVTPAFLWELLDSNQRPPPCKGDALNQLS